ncbi:MAG: hemin uptake protein HemP [Rhodospirillales bacterium]|nr:MAG: hemin uptake protein HemP [Rhodospirillales bacterium]
MKREQDEASAPATPTKAEAADEQEIDSEKLLGTGKRIAIRHNGQRYQLRVTNSGGLILTK